MLVTASGLAIAFLKASVPALVSFALGVLALTLAGVRANLAQRRAERHTAACLVELQKRHAYAETVILFCVTALPHGGRWLGLLVDDFL